MKNKIALITGSTSGIGLEIAKQLLTQGVQVVVNYAQNDKQANEAKKQLARYAKNFIIIKADVSDEKAVAKMFAEIKSKFGRLDFLVNNAGANTDDFITKFNVSDFERVIKVNLVGKFLCTKHAMPLLKQSATGAIVNISSNLGVRPATECSAYCAAAAAIINLTQTTVLELAGTGIRANTVCPGFTPTPLSLAGWTAAEIKEKERMNPLRRNATTTDIANAVLFLLSDKAAFVNGQNLLVNGGSVMK